MGNLFLCRCKTFKYILFCKCKCAWIISRNLLNPDKSFFFSDGLVSGYLFKKHSQFCLEIKYPMTYNIRNKAMYMQS